MNQLPFIPGQVYHRRRDIHEVYKGNWQSGIAASSTHPYIFIFTGSSGHQHGYEDRWDNPNVFSYTGEGQLGDMEFKRGNRALRDHLLNGKRVFLFEQYGKGSVRFVDEVEVIDWGFFDALDREGSLRIGIKFFFKRKHAILPYEITRLPEQMTIADSILPPEYSTQQQRFVNTRVGQGAYRKRIIHRWEYECAVTGFNHLEVLVASHIVPWSQADDVERLDVHNGILLSPTYDALFDRHLVTFEDSGKIILSNRIEPQAFKKIGVHGDEKIKKFSSQNYTYLANHREAFFL